MFDESSQKLKDEEILDLSINKNPDYFGIIVERYEDAFLRKARSIVGSREEAEELVQDAFTKIYIHGPKFEERSGARFSSWAYRILINTCVTAYNRNKRRRTQNISEEMAEYMLREENYAEDRFDVGERILFAMSKLPEALQRVLKLQYMEGYSQKEIADIENISIGAVKSRAFRAKEQFREIINENGK